MSSEQEPTEFFDQVRFKIIVNLKKGLISTLSERSKNKLIRHGFKNGKYEELFTIEIEHKLADKTPPENQVSSSGPIFNFHEKSSQYQALITSEYLNFEDNTTVWYRLTDPLPKFSLLTPNRIFTQNEINSGKVYVELVPLNHLVTKYQNDTIWFEVYDDFGNTKKVKLQINWNVIDFETASLINFVCEGENIDLKVKINGNRNHLPGSFISLSVDKNHTDVNSEMVKYPIAKQLSFNPMVTEHSLKIEISENATRGTGDKFIFLDLKSPQNSVLNMIKSRASIRVLSNCSEKTGYYEILETYLKTKDGENYLRDNDSRLFGDLTIKNLKLENNKLSNGLVVVARVFNSF